jgi:LmbE family N-acetylglucosaminyl deacetylase
VRKLGLGRRQRPLPSAFPTAVSQSSGGTHWDLPYVSPYTGKDQSPYPDTVDPHVEYEGRDLTAVMARLIADFRPTVIIMPHPSDTHPDHSSASWFVTEALQRVQAEGRLSRDARLLTYLVHYPSWAAADGSRHGPPARPHARARGDRMERGGTLTPEELDAKRARARRVQEPARRDARLPPELRGRERASGCGRFRSSWRGSRRSTRA